MQKTNNRFNMWSAGAAKQLSNKRFIKLALLLGAVALAGAAVLLPRGADAQSGNVGDANYADVRSALNGMTHLLRQDDVVVNLGGYTPANGADYSAATLSAITTADSNGSQNYDGFEIPGTCESCPYSTLYYQQDTTVTTGRFFKTLQDTVVTYPSRRQNQDLVDVMTGTRNGSGNASFDMNISQPLPYGTNTTTVSRAYAADFNGDGYDDLLMTYSDYITRFPGNQRMRIATANDVNDPSQGLNFGSEQLLNLPDAFQATAVGDFNGDGQPDIAYVSEETDNVLTLFICSVDPQTLRITRQQQAFVDTLASSDQNQQIQLVAGNFTGSNHLQLVVATPSATNNHTLLRVFDFANESYAPLLQKTWDSGSTATNIKLLTSKFDQGSPYDVISFMQTTLEYYDRDKSYVYLLTVDPASYAITESAVVDVAGTYGPTDGPGLPHVMVALDIAVGNFNNLKPNPVDTSLKINDPNLQLAVATALHWNPDQNRFYKSSVNIIEVIDQQTGHMSLAPLRTIPVKQPNTTEEATFDNITINSADLQGRSLRLGSGYKIVVNKTSPSLILAQPPMHVDWAPINLSSPNSTVVNLSFAQDRFNSTYTTTDSTNNTSNNSKTTGWGFSGKESLAESLTFGKTDSAGNLESGLKIDETFTAQQAKNKSIETTYGTSTTTSQTIAQTTGANDVVWFEDGITYLYAYDVIGQMTCPAGKPNCQESEKVPLTVQVSAPGPTTTQYLSAEALEWYQPVWENGNVLSYPANSGQLLKYMDNQTKVLGSATQRTDTAVSSFTTTWAGTQSQGQNLGFSKVFTEDSDTSIEGANSGTIFNTGVSENTTLAFDFGGSDSLSTLRTSSSSIEQAKGMTINKNVNFPDSNVYGYNFSGVIFGKTAPLSYFDGTDPNTPGSGLPPVSNDLNIFGPMRSAFTVDPLANNQGGWWSHSYTAAPDVALNHPNRWSQNKIGSSTPLPNNCLDTNDGYMDCATQKTRLPIDPWDDQFHSMRGFFIFKSGEDFQPNPTDPYNQGLQQQTATAGDQLSLQARVYNYSLKQMPAGTQVKVRFYAMPWDTTTMLPKDYVDTNNPGGASFLVGETTLPPISAWNNDTSNPNYSIAGVNFDTTGHDDQDLVFWVAVWMQDANGNIVQELPGKGLTAIPGNSSSARFLDMTNLEPTTPNLWKENDDDPATTSFSNNIGFYHQPFYIAPENAEATQVAAGDYLPNIRRGLEAVTVRDIDVIKPSISLGQSTEVHATLQNKAKENLAGASVYFYDGDPAQGGRLFDIDRLAYIRARADHKVRARFTPQACGMHQIFVRVSRSGMYGATGRVATPLRVTCTVPNSGDTTPPQLTVTLTPDTIWTPNGMMIPVTANIEVSDAVDPRPEIRLESITHNQASDARDDVADAMFGTDDRAFMLRAKRSKRSPELIYEVIYSATDWAGNVTYVKAYVKAP